MYGSTGCGSLCLRAMCLAAVAAGSMLTGCVTAPTLRTPAVAVDLPEEYNTPDGMTLDREGNILLSIPNVNVQNFPAKVLKIDPHNRVSEFITLPPHPATGHAFPMGIVVGSDGNVYVSDNQGFADESHKSRLLKIVMENGRPVRCVTVVQGFVIANGIDCHGDYIYVAETKLDPLAYPLPSGVYRFKISELSGRRPVRLLPGGRDEHLVTTLYTKNKDWQVGANGLAVDGEGNLFVCNFGDAEVVKVILDESGRAVSQKVVARGSGMQSCDGMKMDPRTGDLYVADFVGNAVHKIDPRTGKVTTIARNGNTDGRNGELDRPSEPQLRGNKLYVANIDLPAGDNVYDSPHTISVINLDR